MEGPLCQSGRRALEVSANSRFWRSIKGEQLAGFRMRVVHFAGSEIEALEILRFGQLDAESSRPRTGTRTRPNSSVSTAISSDGNPETDKHESNC